MTSTENSTFTLASRTASFADLQRPAALDEALERRERSRQHHPTPPTWRERP